MHLTLTCGLHPGIAGQPRPVQRLGQRSRNPASGPLSYPTDTSTEPLARSHRRRLTRARVSQPLGRLTKVGPATLKVQRRNSNALLPPSQAGTLNNLTCLTKPCFLKLIACVMALISVQNDAGALHKQNKHHFCELLMYKQGETFSLSF